MYTPSILSIILLTMSYHIMRVSGNSGIFYEKKYCYGKHQHNDAGNSYVAVFFFGKYILVY